MNQRPIYRNNMTTMYIMNRDNMEFIKIVKKKLDRYEVKPISNFDILKVLPTVKIISYSELNGCEKFPFDDDNRLVIFYELEGAVGHWVCVMYYPESDTASWFDSYGFKVDGVLSDMPKSELQKLGESGKIATKIMKNYTKAVYNPVRFQALKDAQTCGKHVCTRLLLMHLGVQDYANWMKSLSEVTGLSPDELVCVILENPKLIKQ